MNDQVRALVERYERLTPQQRDRLTEETTKTSLITPLFRALGWDTEDSNEMAMEEAASGGRVDYAFRIHGVTRLYVEAKRHSADLYDIEHARQAINYAFNKGVPWAILTNFEHLVVFDAFAQAPREAPPPRVFDLSWRDYANPESGIKFLTRDAIAEDKLREEAERRGIRRRSVELQSELYVAMRGWRETLINQIAAVMGYSLEEIHYADEAVQRLLNRLIFLRNCEDRGISEDRLRAIFNQWRTNPERVHLGERFAALFARAADTYDSELFSTDALIDVLLPRLGGQIDRVLGEVLTGLYYPPGSYAGYNFKDIDSDVLGAVYEQYLGHVAERTRTLAVERERQLSLGIQVPAFSVESRRQRRKDQGIYYTPKWVVDYIVQQTLGQWLNEHGDDSEALEHLAVLDPACGSGSFLIKAYETLLEQEARRTNQSVDMLDRSTREHILRQNIYGVDLDNQAVEIARLNLLLRMVREEEHLPPLANEIVRGNSLVSGREAELRPYFGDAWEEEHPLNWDVTFKEVAGRGGFDVVIGNPPYVGFQGFTQEKEYLREHYETAVGRFDLFVPFIELALQMLREGGYAGFICPSNFMKREYGAKLRSLLMERAQIVTIVNFEHGQIFEGAINYTCILILRKRLPEESVITYHPGGIDTVPYLVPQSTLPKSGWVFVPPRDGPVLAKVSEARTVLLGEIASINEGVVTGENSVFLIPIDKAARLGIEPALLKPAIQGRHIERYGLDKPTHLLLYPYNRDGDKTARIEESAFRAKYPRAYSYLDAARARLSGRGYFDRSRKAWYELWNERNYAQQAVQKVVVQEVADRGKFAIASEDEFYLDTVCGLVLNSSDSDRLLYLLGLLNSTLLDYYYKRVTVPKVGGFYIYKTMFLKNLPIKFSDDNALNQRIATNSTRMLELRRRLGEAVLLADTEKESLYRAVQETDRAIDELVYDLYGLTAEERRLVEGEVEQR